MNLSSVSPAFATRRLLSVPRPPFLSHSRLCWAAFVGLLAASYLVVARSCAYDHLTLLNYGFYVVFYVWMPGCILLAGAQGRRPSMLEFVCTGLPLGFAAEICVFLAASALHAKAILPFSPVIWIVLGLFKFPRIHRTFFRPRDHGWGLGTPATCCAVAGLVLAFVVTVVSRFYAGAPFIGGVLGSSTHHDWVYLLSRAAEIKTRWPLQDPSMAGQPLSYHYFLLIHLASASLVTGIKLEMLGLRLFVLPLSAALIAQAVCLGRLMSRNLWGGILAGVLAIAANELSFQSANSEGAAFANNFVSWLFISPTFFFGMVYIGALILWIYRLLAADRISTSEWSVLTLLAMIGTGAKGTVVPPLIIGLSIWIGFEAVQTRRFPTKTAFMILALGAGFASVYFSVLSEWGTGAASFSPLASMKLSQFWQTHVDGWQLALEGAGFGIRSAGLLAAAAGLAVYSVGYSGVTLLSIFAVWRWKDQSNPILTLWLGVMAFVYFTFGHLIAMDCNAQLYVLYPVRIPQAALTAGVVLYVVARVRARLNEFGGLSSVYARGVGLLMVAAMVCAAVAAGTISWWYGVLAVNIAAFVAAPSKRSDVHLEKGQFFRYVWRTGPLLLVLAVTAVQIHDWHRQNSQGFRVWLHQPSATSSSDVTLLRGAMDWIRVNTPADAIFVANAFSDKNLKPDALAELDRTTVDKYYYYSALAERRFWVEGPTYLRSQKEASRRVAAASRVFYDGAPVSVLLAEKHPPDFLLIDRRLNDGVSVRLSRERCVFENSRISIYRLTPTAETQSTAGLVSTANRS